MQGLVMQRRAKGHWSSKAKQHMLSQVDVLKFYGFAAVIICFKSDFFFFSNVCLH